MPEINIYCSKDAWIKKNITKNRDQQNQFIYVTKIKSLRNSEIFMSSTNYSSPNEISTFLLTSTPSDNFNLLRAKTKVGQCFRNQLMLTW